MGIQPREMFATVGAGLLGVASSLINGLLSKVAGVVPSISLRAVLKMVSKSFEQGVAERTGCFSSRLERFHHGRHLEV